MDKTTKALKKTIGNFEYINDLLKLDKSILEAIINDTILTANPEYYKEYVRDVIGTVHCARFRYAGVAFVDSQNKCVYKKISQHEYEIIHQLINYLNAHDTKPESYGDDLYKNCDKSDLPSDVRNMLRTDYVEE